MSYFILMGRRIPKQAITGFKFQNETDNIRPFSLTEEDLRVTMERDVELSAVAGAVKNQHHKKKI